MDVYDFCLLLLSVFSFALATLSVVVVIGRTINLVALGLLLSTIVALRAAYEAMG